VEKPYRTESATSLNPQEREGDSFGNFCGLYIGKRPEIEASGKVLIQKPSITSPDP
jgi:hypothetical protein